MSKNASSYTKLRSLESYCAAALESLPSLKAKVQENITLTKEEEKLISQRMMELMEEESNKGKEESNMRMKRMEEESNMRMKRMEEESNLRKEESNMRMKRIEEESNLRKEESNLRKEESNLRMRRMEEESKMRMKRMEDETKVFILKLHAETARRQRNDEPNSTSSFVESDSFVYRNAHIVSADLIPNMGKRRGINLGIKKTISDLLSIWNCKPKSSKTEWNEELIKRLNVYFKERKSNIRFHKEAIFNWAYDILVTSSETFCPSDVQFIIQLSTGEFEFQPEDKGQLIKQAIEILKRKPSARYIYACLANRETVWMIKVNRPVDYREANFDYDLDSYTVHQSTLSVEELMEFLSIIRLKRFQQKVFQIKSEDFVKWKHLGFGATSSVFAASAVGAKSPDFVVKYVNPEVFCVFESFLDDERRVLEALKRRVRNIPTIIPDYCGPSTLAMKPLGVPLTGWTESVFCQVLDILVAAHDAGYVHRDARLENVIMFEGSAYLIDWTFAVKVGSLAYFQGAPLDLLPRELQEHVEGQRKVEFTKSMDLEVLISSLIYYLPNNPKFLSLELDLLQLSRAYDISAIKETVKKLFQ